MCEDFTWESEAFELKDNSEKFDVRKIEEGG